MLVMVMMMVVVAVMVLLVMMLVARLRDGAFRAEVMENLDETGGYTSSSMFEGTKAEIEYVQVSGASRGSHKRNTEC